MYKEQRKRTRAMAPYVGLSHAYSDAVPQMSGTVIFDLKDAQTGEQITFFEKKNIIVRDAGIVDAAHYYGNMTGGVKMLAVGTGATGSLLSPDAPLATQRRLNTEIARKAFSTKTYRTSSGAAVNYRTNIVDFTTIFSESEAVGALNEMGLMVPASLNPEVKNPINNGPHDYNPAIDVEGKDLLVNYLTFGVIVKPANGVLALTWRLTF